MCRYFFVDSIPFILAVSRNIRHVFVEVLESRAMITRVLPLLKRLADTYVLQRFSVCEIHIDLEFEPLRPKFLKPENRTVDVHICAPNTHVPEAERNIRTVKEWDRATVAGLPYLYYPRILKVAIVKASARALNIIPHVDGVSEVFGPFTLIQGHHVDFKKHCALAVGSYCEVHDEPHPTNTETVRTTSGIALGPTPDLDGPWEFLSLQSGRKVVRRAWTQLPITADVIRRVHALADVDDDADPDAFLHEWRPNVPILDLPEDQLDLALRAPPGGAGDVPDDNVPAAAPPVQNDQHDHNNNENTSQDEEDEKSYGSNSDNSSYSSDSSSSSSAELDDDSDDDDPPPEAKHDARQEPAADVT